MFKIECSDIQNCRYEHKLHIAVYNYDALVSYFTLMPKLNTGLMTMLTNIFFEPYIRNFYELCDNVKDNEFIFNYIMNSNRHDGIKQDYCNYIFRKNVKSILYNANNIIKIIDTDSKYYLYLDEECKKDQYIMLNSFKKKYDLFRYADYTIKSDINVARKAIKWSWHNILYVDNDLINNNIDLIKDAVDINIASIGYINSNLYYNTELIDYLIKKSSDALIYVLNNVNIKRFCDIFGNYLIYRDILNVNELLNNFGKYEFIPERYHNNKDIVIKILKKNGMSFSSVKHIYENDYNTVYIAVSNAGMALEFASDRLKANAKICYIAIKNNPLCFKYVDECLLDNSSFVLKIINLVDIPYISDKILCDKEKLKYFIKNNKKAVYIPIEYMNDYDIVKYAISCNGNYLKYVPEKYKKDIELNKIAIENGGVDDIRLINPNVLDNKEIVELLISKKESNSLFLSEYINNDLYNYLMPTILQNNGYHIKDKKEYHSDKKLILIALNTYAYIYNNISKDLQNDKDILRAISLNRNFHIQYLNVSPENIDYIL